MVIVKLSKRRHKTKIKRTKTKLKRKKLKRTKNKIKRKKVQRTKTKVKRTKTKGGAPRDRSPSPSPPPPQEPSRWDSIYSYFNPGAQVEQAHKPALPSEPSELNQVLVSMDDKIKGIVTQLNRKQTLDQQNYPVQLILGDIIEPDEALQVIVPFFDSLIDQYGLTHEQGNGIRNDIQQWIVDKTSEFDRDIDALNTAYDNDVVILNNRHDANINSLKIQNRGYVVEYMRNLLRVVEENHVH